MARERGGPPAQNAGAARDAGREAPASNRKFLASEPEGRPVVGAAVDPARRSSTGMQPVSRARLGELLVQDNLLTSEQLEHAVAVQARQSIYRPLGEVCVKLGFLSRSSLQDVIRRTHKRIALKDLLVNVGLLSQVDADECAAEAEARKLSLLQVVLQKQLVVEDTLINAISQTLGIPKMEPALSLIDTDLLKTTSLPFLERCVALPVSKKDNVVTIICADPLSTQVLRDLESAFKAQVEPAIAPQLDILAALTQLQHAQRSAKDPTATRSLVVTDGPDGAKLGDDRIAAVLDYLLSNAVQAGASDIHIEPLESTLRIRFRIDGHLRHITDMPIHLARELVSRLKVLCGLDIAERRKHQDGRLVARVNERDIDLRLSTYASLHGETVVIRLLLRKTSLIDIEQVGFNPENLRRYRKLLTYPGGVILVTGPTGSGKTTTLYGSLVHLNNQHRKIITVEDPVEYAIDGIVQGQLNTKIEHTYADFLKAMMRQDPDVIMVGEIREKAAAEAVVQAALTGHKVFSTLHTDDTTGALLRLMDMGIDVSLISSTVVSVVSQRLVRVLCKHCKVAGPPPREMLASYGMSESELSGCTFFQPRGCRHCMSTGYKGRTAIHEMLVMNDAIRDAILRRLTSTQIRATARADGGLVSMREDGFYKASLGITTLEEVVRAVMHSEDERQRPRSAAEILRLCGGLPEHSGLDGLTADEVSSASMAVAASRQFVATSSPPAPPSPQAARPPLRPGAPVPAPPPVVERVESLDLDDDISMSMDDLPPVPPMQAAGALLSAQAPGMPAVPAMPSSMEQAIHEATDASVEGAPIDDDEPIAAEAEETTDMNLGAPPSALPPAPPPDADGDDDDVFAAGFAEPPRDDAIEVEDDDTLAVADAEDENPSAALAGVEDDVGAALDGIVLRAKVPPAPPGDDAPLARPEPPRE